MRKDRTNQMNFLSEMSEYQISAKEFFGRVLLDSLDRNFGFKNVLISYFDAKGNFLSWTRPDSIMMDCESHPYRAFQPQDVIRRRIYEDAVSMQMDFSNFKPVFYKSTELIEGCYEKAPYVRFIAKNFNAYYSVSCAFGINGYIQTTFFKTREEGDFTDEEIQDLAQLYVYIASAYRNFKKVAHSKIFSAIQNEVIASGERAYFITDDSMHIISYNSPALECIREILGPSAVQQILEEKDCHWLPFLLEGGESDGEKGHARVRTVKNYVFKIYTYDEVHPCGIVERFHWITTSKQKKEKHPAPAAEALTPAEQKVAELMYQGLTYQNIADQLVVSYHTVKNHVQNIYAKCGVKNRYELYKWMEEQQ